ncbi:hypothetical protein [Paludisphaera rhizosphaerae]|uniref:hypothetical protein n=1 Tax=Paludisphaera rhizosphaerae TaxID=2711216 RepID=UPI0013EA3A26|nr:hypothetical protein [Paludisphaera rhizosphaerae]
MPAPLRRLSFADTMMLVAAVGVGVGATQLSLRVMPGMSRSFAARLTIILFALALTIVLIPLRLRRPRPRRIGRLPGLAACDAVALSLAFIVVEQANGWLRPEVQARPAEPYFWAIDLIFSVARIDFYSLAVAVSWLTLAVSGRWRPEPDLIDRAGRMLGVLWILSPFLVTWIELIL